MSLQLTETAVMCSLRKFKVDPKYSSYTPFINLPEQDHAASNEVIGSLIRNPEDRYAGYVNVYGNCWFNVLRQFTKWCGFGNFELEAQKDWRNLYNDLCFHIHTQFPHKLFQTNPNGGFFQGQEMETPFYALGFQISNYLEDSDADNLPPNQLLRYQPYLGGPKKLLPFTIMLQLHPHGDSHVIAVQRCMDEQPAWIVYDDDCVYAIDDPWKIPNSVPLLGHAGTNIGFRFPVRQRKCKKKVGKLAKGNAISDGIEIGEVVLQGAGYSRPTTSGNNLTGNQGTQIINYYQQHYQNSMDMSAHSGATNTPQKGQLSSIIETGSQLASSLLPGVVGMFRDVSGNTAVTDPKELRSVRAYNHQTTDDVTSCADTPTKPGEAVERNYVQTLGIWTTSTAVGKILALPLPTGLENTGVYGEMSRRHYCQKLGWKIQVQVNTSQFHAGCLGVFCIPEFQNLQTLQAVTDWIEAPENPNQWSLYPHQLINCRTNTSANFELPYLNLTPVTSPKQHAPWTLVVMVLTPLQSPHASNAVDVLATVAPQDAKFFGLRHAYLSTSFPVHVKDGAGNFTTTQPDLSQPSYGLAFNPSIQYLPKPLVNALEMARQPTFASLTGEDRFSFVVDQNQKGSVLFKMDVVLTSDAMRFTTVSQLGFRYSQYRGSINVTLVFTGAAAIKGKLLLAFTPPGGDSPKFIEQAMQSTYTLWDIGASSSYTFNLPFISISDFRFTGSSTDDVLSVNGWFTVWQYTSLTYPTNTPERSDVIVMFSAGHDFCYRNLITSRTQSVESGEGVSEDARQLNDKTLVHVDAHTNLAFVMDRSWLFTNFTLNNNDVKEFNLSIKEITKYNKDLENWLKMFTYFRADVEIIASARHEGVMLRWDPVGATPPNKTTSEFYKNIGATPVTVGGKIVKLLVPYTSPLSVIPMHYLGKSTFSSDSLGVMPGASFGSIQLFSSHNVTTFVNVFIRFKNFQGFCPRPTKNYGPNPVNDAARWETRSNAILVQGRSMSKRDELGLTGGVESNPGPFMYKTKLPEVQGFFDAITGGLHSAAVRATNSVDEAAKQMKNTMASMEEILNGFKMVKTGAVWLKIVKKVFKIVSHAIIAYRCKDPVVLSLLGSEFLFDSIFDVYAIFKKYLQPLFSTPPPEIVEEQGVIADVNHIFNLMKNVDWAVKLVKSLKEWLTKWINNELETPAMKLAKILPEFNAAQKILVKRDFEAQKQKVHLLPVVIETADLARQAGKIHIANAAEELLKAYNMTSGHRTEPIVVVLRGDPGQGKTIAATLLAQMLSKKITGSQSVYSLPPDAKHFDGYCGQTVVIMDDLGQNPDGQDFSTFCQMVSTTQFVTPQASLADKGTLFTSPIVIATTNSRNIRPATIASPEAVERRFFLHLETQAVVKDHAGRLDVTQALEPQDCEAKAFEYLKDVLSYKPNILSSSYLRFQTVKDKNLFYSLETVYNLVLDKLLAKEGVSDKLASVVLQGVLPSHILKTHQSRKYVEVVDGVEYQIEQSVDEERDLSDHLSNLVCIAAAVAQICCFLTLMFTFVSWLCSRNSEKEEKEETKEEGPYSGTPKTRAEKKKLAKQVVEGPYSGLKKGDVKKNLQKVVEQSDEEYKKLEARFVKLHKNEEPVAVQSQEVLDWEMSLVKRNLVPVVYYSGSVAVASLTALKVCNGKALINKHQFDYDNWDHISIGDWVETRDNTKVTGFLNQATSLDYDVYMIDVPGMQCRDIRDCFTDTPPEKEEIMGICHSKRYPSLMWSGRVTRVIERLPTTTDILPCTLNYNVPTKAGFCGAPIIATRNGKKIILAIHSAGNGNSGFGTIVTKRMITAATQGIKVDKYLGPRVHVNRKSNIKKSPLFDVFKPQAGPAVLSEYDRRLLPEVSLEKALFEKHTGNMKELPAEFTIATEMYAAELFGKIGTDNGVVTIDKALNGDGITDAMDMDTSVGYPYVLAHAKRRDFVDVVETETGNVLVPKPELVEETKKFFSGRTKPIFVTFLKDEVRSMEKVKNGKTRVVDASPFPYAIAGRMVLMKFMSNIMRNNGTLTGIAVGCDPDVDWTRYAHELCDEYVFDVDYKSFDSTHTTAMFDLLANHFFLDKYGFDNELVRVFLAGLSTSWHVYENQYFILEGGLPSGCPATSILNSVINNIIVRAAILGVYKADSVNWDSFRMLSYGDDLVYASNQPILPGELAAWLHSKTLYKLTPASKAGEFPTESTIWDVTFLKRAFVPDEKFPLLIKPVMSVKNIETILSFTRPGTFPDKVRSVAGLAFHLPADEYEKLAEALLSVDGCAYFPAQAYLKHVWYEKNS